MVCVVYFMCGMVYVYVVNGVCGVSVCGVCGRWCVGVYVCMYVG